MDELYVLARRVLLDALEALAPHLDAIVLVGAQAIYLHVGDADLAVAPYTTDGDLLLDPGALGEVPPLEQALMSAGFLLKEGHAVGIWVARCESSSGDQDPVPVDLLVPDSLSPRRGRRAAGLPGHARSAARNVVGLEGALVDRERVHLRALDKTDDRVYAVQAAGPGALLVAKLTKLRDRRDTNRLSDKDALDIARLLRGVATHDLAERIHRLLTDSRSHDITTTALKALNAFFGNRAAPGIRMAMRSAGGLVDADELALSCKILANDLLQELGRGQ